jgi:iron complex outermembrane receptor protein
MSGRRLVPLHPILQALILLAALPATAGGAASIEQMRELSLEDLMNVEVVTASRRSHSYQQTAAAAYVITGEQLRRSTAASIPEALRGVPGLQVARIDASKWAISARGFNGLYANKLLVLVDGRSVYNSLFSGVYWDILDLRLGDVERIEIIRGPGGTAWGANAFNGVINIITRHARETLGTAVEVGIGDNDPKILASLRHGGRIGPNAWYRVSGKHLSRDGFVDHAERETDDGHEDSRAGLRVDWAPSARDAVMVGASAFTETFEQRLFSLVGDPPTWDLREFDGSTRGGNLLVDWERQLGRGALGLQAYYDETRRDSGVHEQETRTLDLELQQSVAIGRHAVLWGAGFRTIRDTFYGTSTMQAPAPERTREHVSLFVQDELSLASDRLRINAGAKLEHHDGTGVELQPSVRAAWLPNDATTVWGAVSRASRVPSRLEEELRMNVGVIPYEPLPVLLSLFGNPDLRSETVDALEFGVRRRWGERVSLDVASFFNRYDHLLSTTAVPPFIEETRSWSRWVFGAEWTNEGQGEGWGLEAATDVHLAKGARLRASYTYLGLDLELTPGREEDSVLATATDLNPRHQLSLVASLDLPRSIFLDVSGRFVDDLEGFGIDEYTSVDVRVSFRPRDDLELALVGRDLLEDSHFEFYDFAFGNRLAQVERRGYLTMRWSF